MKEEYDIQKIQREYQEQFKEILKNCPLSEEERETYLSTEAMAAMPLDDYLILLKRLSGEAFYHVTRYGVRENTFMSTGGGHTVGAGDFTDNLNPLLESGYINSASATMLNNEDRLSLVTSEAVKTLKEAGKTADEVVEIIMNELKSSSYLDRESAHFSYGKDLHHMYGGEDNYKFYFYYPVEYIMQNDFFHQTREPAITIGHNFFNNQIGINQQYNDFEIFNFGAGVPIEAGLLCVTGNIEVDPETGSQYLLKNGKPEVDEAGNFKKPKVTISSKEYWEKYFLDNPGLKPSKIIYNNFSTASFKDSNELKEAADYKKISNQGAEKIQEFEEYERYTREGIKKNLQELVKKEFNA